MKIKDKRFLFSVFLVVAISGIGSSQNLNNLYVKDVEAGLRKCRENMVWTSRENNSLPEIVQKYLEFTGANQTNKMQSVYAAFEGSIRTEPGSDWMDLESEQYVFFNDPARLFFMNARKKGLPIKGYHRYKDESAFRKVKVASLYTAVNKSGPEIFQSETVTYFYDLCLLAPANLILADIEWREINPTTVEATFTNKGATIQAVLSFDKQGRLIRFISDDRYYSKDGEIVDTFRWTSFITGYAEMDSFRLADQAEAYWHAPEGKYKYATFRLIDLKYNCINE